MQESQNTDAGQSPVTEIIKPKNKFSWRTGVDLYLTHAGNRICVNNSSWSGVERVYVNGELIIARLNMFSKTGTHTFSVAGIDYVLVLYVASIMKGRINATLYANNEKVDFEEINIEEHMDFGSNDDEAEANNTQTKEGNSSWNSLKQIGVGLLTGIGGYLIVNYILSLLFK
jgi:hypothetical protein